MVTTMEAPSTAPVSIATSRFTWHDLMSTDRDASMAFFSGLFGWEETVFDMGEMGTYLLLSAGGQLFGGAMSMEPDQGHGSHFIGYISCADVDAVAARIPELGGNVPVPPMDIPDVGRFAVCQDPMGAYFSILTSLPTAPAAPATDVPHGGVVWNELSSTDTATSGAFYANLFGWTLQNSMAEMPDYTVLTQRDYFVGGLLPSAHQGMPSAWLAYFGVENIDASAAKVAELGGTMQTPIVPVPTIGRIAIAMDPTGAVFAMLESAS